MAVSGGVDSVVLLDMLARGDDRIIVAHVDHGIRPESAADARFVKALAAKYRLPYCETRLKLGANASEERARTARYDFLYEIAAEHNAHIVTAHHQDDLIGSIAINFTRGTGWRGLSVLNRARINRPLLGLTKSKLYEYALKHRLEWVEDDTNRSSKYLRNRLRASTLRIDKDAARELVKLRQRQIQLAHDINIETGRLMIKFDNIRYPYQVIPLNVAREIVRMYVETQTGYRPSSQQIDRLVLAIKTAEANTSIDIVKDIAVRFTRDTFIVVTLR